MEPHCRNTALTANTSYGNLSTLEAFSWMKEEAFRSVSSDFSQYVYTVMADQDQSEQAQTVSIVT